MEYIPSNADHETDTKTTSTMEGTKEYKTWKTQQLKRRICIGSIGILFLLAGVTIIVVVDGYINNTHEICSNPSEKLLSQHPELYYWNDHCSTKLTPFGSRPPCDCRTLDIEFSPIHYREYNFSKQHIISIMSNFKMMTFLNLAYDAKLILIVDHMTSNGQIELAKELFYVNLTKECFISKKLNHLNLFRLYLIDLDWDAVSSLQLLQVLGVHGAIWQNPVNWVNIGKLTNLKYLNMRESALFLTGKVGEAICNLKQLRYLDLQTNFISGIPDCIGDLTELYGVNLRGLPAVEYVTPNLFKLPNIFSIVADFSAFNSSSIPGDSNWGKSLKTIFLQGNPVCNELDALTTLQLQFIDNFEACFTPCPGQTRGCSKYEWGDGRCDEECCDFDGGDCHQTCGCNKSLWLNDKCDIECNTTLCAYDFGDCLPTINSNETESECVENSGCYEEWQNDGWCDNNCFALNTNKFNIDDECGDIYDCDIENQCEQSSECFAAYMYIIHAGASQSEPKELIDIDEACNMWDFFLMSNNQIKNCTIEFPKADINNDGYVSFWESLQISASFWGLTPEKAAQVNCSLCLEDPALYY